MHWVVDLSAIARTSGAFSQSPPEGESILSSSPVRNMDAVRLDPCHSVSSDLEQMIANDQA